MKRLLGIVFGIVLAALCLWLFFRGVQDPGQLWRAMTSASLPLLLGLVLSAVLHMLLRAWRWRTLLGDAGRDVPYLELFSAVCIGYMAMLLPGRVSEVIRPAVLSRRTRVPFGTSLATVGAERAVLDLPALVLFTALFLVLPQRWTGLAPDADPRTLAWIRGSGVFLLAGSAAALAAVALLGRHRAVVGGWIDRWSARRNSRVVRTLGGWISSLLPGLATFGSVRGLLRLGAETLVIWGVIAAGIQCGVLAVGVPLAPLAALIIIPVTAAGIAVPTPAGAGTYQIAMQAVLTAVLQVPNADSARAAALVDWAVPLVPIVLLGAFFAVRGGFGARDARADVDEAARVATGETAP